MKKIDRSWLLAFVIESNAIENITRPPTEAELAATEAFLALPALTIANVADLVRVYQPDAVLRVGPGLNVRVGDHVPPRGGPGVPVALDGVLRSVSGRGATPWTNHLAYENLHPFTDGNGRSGRAIWAWDMRQRGWLDWRLTFLRHFYYQTLAESR